MQFKAVLSHALAAQDAYPGESRVAVEIPLAALTALVLVRKRSCCVNRRSCNHKQRNKTGLIREQGHCNTHREREGFGGEKAVRCAASLPVPLGASTCSEVKQSRASWHWLGTRRRGAEMRWGLSAKKREDPSYFRGSYSDRPAPAAEPGITADLTWHRHHAGRRRLGGRRIRPPAPPIPLLSCRMQGVWGAADTPPAPTIPLLPRRMQGAIEANRH